jgi:hypothetical protein
MKTQGAREAFFQALDQVAGSGVARMDLLIPVAGQMRRAIIVRQKSDRIYIQVESTKGKISHE